MAKVTSKESVLASIEKTKKAIEKQNAKLAKLEAQLKEINRQELVSAILDSGKSMDEIMQFIKS
jgi:septal ring factor EnvC (AmiA/AmiB activator)